MKLDEINSLITVRNYVNQTLNNNAIDRPTLSELGETLLLLDNKIIKMLKEPEFKEYIDFGSIKKVLKDTRQITSGVFDEANRIKAGLK